MDPDDDNEFARYLAQYLVDNQERFIVENFTGYFLDQDDLESTIRQFLDVLP